MVRDVRRKSDLVGFPVANSFSIDGSLFSVCPVDAKSKVFAKGFHHLDAIIFLNRLLSSAVIFSKLSLLKTLCREEAKHKAVRRYLHDHIMEIQRTEKEEDLPQSLLLVYPSMSIYYCRYMRVLRRFTIFLILHYI